MALLQLDKSGYYFITSSSDNPVTDVDVVETVEMALKQGAKIIQYREKVLSYQEMLPVTLKIRWITRKHCAIFLVNDHIDLAIAVKADGVHLGKKDTSYHEARRMLGNGRIIGISCSTVEQAEKMALAGADYVSMGPVFKTSTKTDADPPCGVGAVERLRRMIEKGTLPRIPIAAIGGIDKSNYKDIIKAGADWVCSIHPVLSRKNISSRIESFISGVERAGERRDSFY